MYEPIRSKPVVHREGVHRGEHDYPHRSRAEALDIQLAGHLSALLALTDELGLEVPAERIAAQVARLRGARPARAAGVPPRTWRACTGAPTTSPPARCSSPRPAPTPPSRSSPPSAWTRTPPPSTPSTWPAPTDGPGPGPRRLRTGCHDPAPAFDGGPARGCTGFMGAAATPSKGERR